MLRCFDHSDLTDRADHSRRAGPAPGHRVTWVTLPGPPERDRDYSGAAESPRAPRTQCSHYPIFPSKHTHNRSDQHFTAQRGDHCPCAVPQTVTTPTLPLTNRKQGSGSTNNLPPKPQKHIPKFLYLSQSCSDQLYLRSWICSHIFTELQLVYLVWLVYKIRLIWIYYLSQFYKSPWQFRTFSRCDPASALAICPPGDYRPSFPTSFSENSFTFGLTLGVFSSPAFQDHYNPSYKSACPFSAIILRKMPCSWETFHSTVAMLQKQLEKCYFHSEKQTLIFNCLKGWDNFQFCWEITSLE